MIKLTVFGTRSVNTSYTMEIDESLLSKEDIAELKNKTMALIDVRDLFDKHFDPALCVVEIDENSVNEGMYDYEVGN